MKRTDDIIRILSSVLLGMLIKDFHSLSDNLNGFFRSFPNHSAYAGIIATLTAITLIGLFVRNIHGSARYDDFVEKKEYVLSLDATVAKRSSAFLLTFLGLFIGPVLASHIIAYHLPKVAGNSSWWVIAPLFFTLAVYAVWDLFLWLGDVKHTTNTESLTIQDVAHRWLKIDAYCLALLTALLIVFVIYQGKGLDFPPELIGIGFIVISGVAIFGDYISNRLFYFPQPKRKSDVTKEYFEQRIEEQTINLFEYTHEQTTKLKGYLDQKVDELSSQIGQKGSERAPQTNPETRLLSELVLIELLNEHRRYIDQRFNDLSKAIDGKRSWANILQNLFTKLGELRQRKYDH